MPSFSPYVASAVYAASAADATANAFTIQTRLTTDQLESASVSFYATRAGVNTSMAGAVLTRNSVGGNMLVTDGGGWAVAAGDLINWRFMGVGRAAN